MQKFLLIYSLIPESTRYYAVPLNHPDIDLIKSAHGIEVNINDLTEEEEIAFRYINDACAESKFAENPENGGKLLEFEIDSSSLTSTPFEFVVVVNFYL